MASRKTIADLNEKHYRAEAVEMAIYALWEERDVFTADNKSKKEPYTIVIPPPNVTGRLHMGHALNNSVQDALIRFKRMDGYDVLWVPGTDHAGISTQSVVKKALDAQGIDYLELGREKMVERIWEWKEKYGNQILNQLRRMGCSCDWSRTRFTMDDGLSFAVRTAFKKFYDQGLVYRGKYIVNWCPIDRTALSDDEVTTKEGGEPGHLWQFHYPLADGTGNVTIATTRPETMLGDTAIAVNPKDDRFSHLVGKMVRLPLAEREIPIIADDFVDTEFGTGCLKVTPAHDPNDFQIGLRHDLPQVNVLNEDATMGDQAPERYHGLDRYECRERIVNEMRELGLLGDVEERMTPVGRAQRSGAVIEYRLGDQWFVKMRPLAEKALTASDSGDLKLYPERWDKIYREWLEGTRDWCISRQIWWGHRIPAWYNKQTGEVVVDVETPEVVAKNPDEWVQDEDVLDTWFSSALWPYSTMGWPEQTEDLKRYYPTNVLSTAKDIIYFWVARMVMTGMNLMDDVPFRQVYFHAVVCDAQGETMSKSKGNGIDPLHVIAGATVETLEEPIREAHPANEKEMLEHLHKTHPNGFQGVGADALRFTLLSLNSQAQQVQLSLEKFEEVGQRFIDKLWNGARFVLSNLEEVPPASVGQSEPTLADRWILGKLDRTTVAVREALETFHFNEAASALYRYFWDDVCDWYVELAKYRLRDGKQDEIRQVQMTLGEVMAGVLRLLHPLTPHITEELWGHLHKTLVDGELIPKHESSLKEADLCATAPYPQDHGRTDADIEETFSLLQEIVRSARNMRSHAGIAPSAQVEMLIKPTNERAKAEIDKGLSIISRGAGLKSVGYTDSKPEKMSVAVLEQAELFLNLAEHMDVGAEMTRNEAALKKVEKEIEKYQNKLSNEKFLQNAPQAVQDEQRQNLSDAQAKRDKILEAMDQLRELQ